MITKQTVKKNNNSHWRTLKVPRYSPCFFAKLLSVIPKGAAPAELMALGQDWVTCWQALSLSLHYESHSEKLTSQEARLYLIWLLSSRSTFRFLNCRTQRGTSLRWLLSSRSSCSERYVPTKENRSSPSLLKALWDSWRVRRPGRTWRNTKEGMWLMLLCWRVSLRRLRGR